jgi:hypothetical protein
MEEIWKEEKNMETYKLGYKLKELKLQFLIEAFKMGMALDEAELKANLWANAAVKPVPKEQSVEESFVKAEVERIKQKNNDTIKEEDYGVM